MEQLRATLERQGWAVLTTSSTTQFEEVVRRLGVPRSSRDGGPVFEKLRVVTAADAHPHSQSARYGTDAFPFHTDTAHWRVPARYVALRAEARSSRPTIVVDLRDAITVATRRLLQDALFTVVNGRRSFLASAWDGALRLLRYDPTCMRAATRAALRASAALDEIGHTVPPIYVDWARGRTLIIDNWRCLHARGIASEPDTGTHRLTRALLEAGADGTGP